MNQPRILAPRKLAGSFDLLKPSRSYRFHAWLAIAGLIAFFAIYLALASWFTYIAVRMIVGIFSGGDGVIPSLITALFASFFAIFLWKALFFFRRPKYSNGIELTPQSQPELFEFLHQIADSVKAPRVHRVFAAPDVNACVVYDLSILNFFLPTRKNLIIGLGLVNTLNRSEFEAVIAHEFGHFAQRSMAIGRWASIGEQIAGHIIASRDFLDKILQFISSFDLRVAWIGWIMSGIVWAIRSFVATFFSWVVISVRALSREMEFQADLVAVVVSGSDAIVHALYRLQTADDDWDTTLQFIEEQYPAGNVVENLYPLHARVNEHVRRITNDPARGKSPTPTRSLIFKEYLAQPPRMWSTHPANTLRERNAKNFYVEAAEDPREAWSYFRDPLDLQQKMTDFVYSGSQGKKDKTVVTTDRAIELLDEKYAAPVFQTKYQGIYLGRSLTLGAATSDALRGDLQQPYQFEETLANPYPESLSATMASYRNAVEEHRQLVAIQKGYLEAPSGTIRHRGETIRPSQLNSTIEAIKQERERLAVELETHDRAVRTAHLSAAAQLSGNQRSVLLGLQDLLHYAEHRSVDIADAYGALMTEVNVKTAAGRLSSSDRVRIIWLANDLYKLLEKVHQEKLTLKVPATILARLNLKQWSDAFDEFKLAPAVSENLHLWMPVIDSWTLPVIEALSNLESHTLNELLQTEEIVAQEYQASKQRESTSGNVPSSHAWLELASVPERYETRVRGTERKRETQLDGWSKFVIGEGTLPSALRMAVSTCVVLAISIAGLYIGASTLIINNGLSTEVIVSFNEKEYKLSPHSRKRLSIGNALSGHIEARTEDGREIEKLDVTLGRGFAKYVYNVAGAAPLVEWTAVYGNAAEPPPVNLGAVTWHVVHTNYAFEQPPQSITTKSGSAKRTVLSDAPLDTPPFVLLEMCRNEEERVSMIMAHMTWDDADSKDYNQWTILAADKPGIKTAIEKRLQHDPNEVATIRLKYDLGTDQEKAEMRRLYIERAKQDPENSDLAYLALRFSSDSPEVSRERIAASERWPGNLWLAMLAGNAYSESGQWSEALRCFERIYSQDHVLRDSAIVNAARILRHVDRAKPNALEGLPQSMQIEVMLDMEDSSNVRISELRPYALLRQGSLEEAYSVMPDTNKSLRVLVGASLAASSVMKQKAIELNNAEDLADLRIESRMYLGALMLKEGKSREDVLHVLQFNPKEETGEKAINAFAKWLDVEDKSDPNTYLTQHLEGLVPYDRGILIAAFIVAYPTEIERSWKETAKEFLFVPERPYW